MNMDFKKSQHNFSKWNSTMHKKVYYIMTKMVLAKERFNIQNSINIFHHLNRQNKTENVIIIIGAKYLTQSSIHSFLLFFFFEHLQPKFPGQGSNLSHNSNPSHSSDNTRSLSHWATRVRWAPTSVLNLKKRLIELVLRGNFLNLIKNIYKTYD